MARAIQFFAPGIPQVYYVGLLAGKNDIELLEKTKNGRDINRHYYTKEEIAEEIKRDVVKRLIHLMEFRNNYPAFDGDMYVNTTDKEEEVVITWTKGEYQTCLNANLWTKSFTIRYKQIFENEWKTL